MSALSNWGSRLAIGCINLLSRMPLRCLYGLSDCMYPLVHYVLRYRVKIVRKNLALAFPQRTPAERRLIENRFYRYFCDLAVETIKLHSISEAELRRRVVYHNLDGLESSLGDHGFACCYLGHFGNWEWLVGLPLHLKSGGMSQVYHPMRNRLFDRWFLDNRARFGAVNIPMKHTLRRLMTLRDAMRQGTDPHGGYLFGCIADQLPKRENIHYRLQFLNQSTGVFTGSERIGRMLGMSFYYTRIRRPARGQYEVTFEAMDNVDPGTSDHAYTDEYMRRFEADVLDVPELWLWTHDRWKR